jgi:mono/diheme cytochrome c family protein
MRSTKRTLSNARVLRAIWAPGIACAAVAGCNMPDLSDDAFASSSSISFGSSVSPSGPDLGPTISQRTSPPPISGGTLLALADDRTFVASDPDRDRIYIVDMPSTSVHTIALQRGDEPGRLVADADGRVHVALRSGGAVLTVDVATATILERRWVCPAPRGIAFDAKAARLLVACESGELFALDPRTRSSFTTGSVPAPSLVGEYGDGIRDVVIAPPARAGADRRVFVSRFRTSEILELSAADGTVLSQTRPDVTHVLAPSDPREFEPTLAFRMSAPPAGSSDPSPVVVHEIATTAQLPQQPVYYGTPETEGGGPVVRVVVSRGSDVFVAPPTVVLPVDFAFTKDGVAIVAAGNGHARALPQVVELGNGGFTYAPHQVPGQPIAIARTAAGALVVQSREPAFLMNLDTGKQVYLATDTVEDTGHAIFHSNSGAGIACASCHGEGGDDAHVWNFPDVGLRRTPSLRGTVEGTAPYHWDGALVNIPQLVDVVFTGRMGGPVLDPDKAEALQSWLYALPAPKRATPASRAPVKAASIARGKALFERADVGCASCHSGPRFTNSQTVDVGTGGPLQVPSLVGLRARAPYLHTGCARTLEERFGGCATEGHGHTDTLSGIEIDDLIAYLETL